MLEDLGGSVIGQATNYGLVVTLLTGFAFLCLGFAVFVFRAWKANLEEQIKERGDVRQALSAMADLLRSMDQHQKTQRQPNDVLRDMLDLLERRDRARGP